MSTPNPTAFVIETAGLTKQFAGFTAVRDLNLRVRRGAVHALIGPNGAGKTTVFNLLTKFLLPTSGRIFYNGEDITAAEAPEIARRGMVRSFQISAVFPRLTVLENVRFALQQRTRGSFYFWLHESALYDLHDQVAELLRSVDLQGYEDVVAGALPYGRKRALEIATTLALDPKVLLLDEPMAGLGHEDIERVSGLIRQVATSRTVLMVEHNLSVVERLSDTITVLARGEVLAEGSYEAVSKDSKVMEAYLGAGHD